MGRRVHFVAHGGTVQGVGFRYFARRRAAEHGLTGWVRNTANNKVEGEVQGENEAIKAFLKDMDRGPKHAHVVRLDKEDRDPVEGDSAFEIRH
ncbi:hypothetical protein NKR23_g12111 [Pleurostoma richardsiae]|uniref:acylphosphatase n=1 Tax=Pleurostoma richardsiae TaxID=41990 RepID=A0AA38RHB3_9PEZI|nr:hypothetical protein NKR23_g12111 [Pleurostoma richardsiae]